MKIAIAGMGYVGLSNAVLLAQHNEVVAGAAAEPTLDISPSQDTSSSQWPEQRTAGRT